MTHRERLETVLRHRQPDRLPLDLGSTLSSTMTAKAHERLRAYLGIAPEPAPAVFSRRSSTVIPDEAILRRFHACARPVLLGGSEARPDLELEGEAFSDEWGVTWTKPEGGHYINTDGPFCHIDNPGVHDLGKLQWPDPSDPGRYRGLQERAKEIHEQTGYAVVLGLGVGPVHQCQFVRGWAEFLSDLVVNRSFAEALLDRCVDIWVEITDRALEEAGDHVDLVMFGDDVAMQRSTLVSPECYRQVIKPRHRRMTDVVKRHGKPILYHCCGSVRPVIPDLIDIGIDALNPVQVSAADMDTRLLKREFGRDLVFWGAVDSQRVLSRGTAEEVREEVKRRIDDLGEGGGYVLCAVHNLQADVPPENIVTMYETAMEYGCGQ
jgi:uroporphyrinogen decarboxylase